MNAAELVEKFGPIPLWRVRTTPPPGTATFDDLLDLEARRGYACELVDGVLLEKDVGAEESWIAAEILTKVNQTARAGRHGVAMGADGFTRLTTGRTRGPDTSFIAWDRLPGGWPPAAAVPELSPTLAVEVISRGNTVEEMEGKLDDYFGSGVELVWYVYPRRREVVVYTARHDSVTLGESDTLTADPVLPGFTLPLAELFAVPRPPT